MEILLKSCNSVAHKVLNSVLGRPWSQALKIRIPESPAEVLPDQSLDRLILCKAASSLITWIATSICKADMERNEKRQ